MANYEREVIRHIVNSGRGLDDALAAGLTPERCLHPDMEDVLRYLVTFTEMHDGRQPTPQTIAEKFPKAILDHASNEPLPVLLHEWSLWQRRQGFMRVIADVRDKQLLHGGKAGNLEKDLGRLDSLLSNYLEQSAEISNGNGRAELIPFSTIPPEATRWLWPGFLVKKSLNVIAADPKVGKGLLSVWTAAQLTQGRRGWEKRNVSFLGHEDSLGTQAARLVAAGADMSRVSAMRGRNHAILTLPRDADEIRRQVEEGQIGALFIDPINSHVDSGIRTSDDKSMRDVLSPLALIAQQCDCIVVVVHHFSKGTLSQKTLYRLGGSMAYSGVARSVLALGRKDEDDEEDEAEEASSDSRPSPFLKDEPDENSRYLFQCGTNYYGDVTPVRFQVVTETVKVTDGTDEVARFKFIGDANGVSESDIFSGGVKRGRGAPKDEAVRRWIEDYLSGKDEVTPSKMQDAAAADGHGTQWRTIRHVVHEEYGWTAERLEGQGRNAYVWKPPAEVEEEGEPE